VPAPFTRIVREPREIRIANRRLGVRIKLKLPEDLMIATGMVTTSRSQGTKVIRVIEKKMTAILHGVSTRGFWLASMAQLITP
jgi:hypothetical protein